MMGLESWVEMNFGIALKIGKIGLVKEMVIGNSEWTMHDVCWSIYQIIIMHIPRL